MGQNGQIWHGNIFSGTRWARLLFRYLGGCTLDGAQRRWCTEKTAHGEDSTWRRRRKRDGAQKTAHREDGAQRRWCTEKTEHGEDGAWRRWHKRDGAQKT